jgi:hypothetical protein
VLLQLFCDFSDFTSDDRRLFFSRKRHYLDFCVIPILGDFVSELLFKALLFLSLVRNVLNVVAVVKQPNCENILQHERFTVVGDSFLGDFHDLLPMAVSDGLACEG